MRGFALAVLTASLLLPAGCGYHIAGKADLLPKSIQTIYIPAFSNNTVRYRLAERLAQAVTREFISRTRYQIVYDANEADAILRGGVMNIFAFPTTFDTETGRAAGIQMNVILQVNLVERVTGKVLYTNPGMDIRERYEISIDPVAYFEESDTALDRLGKQVASSVVSAILESF